MAGKTKLIPLPLKGLDRTLEISEDGEYNVKNYAYVNVSTGGGGGGEEDPPTPSEPTLLTLAEYASMVDNNTYEVNTLYNVII